MTGPHRIALRRPWECRATAGKTCWLRRFGRPTNLDPKEEVWLVVTGLPAPAVLTLNGQLLGTAELGGATWNITNMLALRNELQMALQNAHPPQSADAPPADVTLEIRPA